MTHTVIVIQFTQPTNQTEVYFSCESQEVIIKLTAQMALAIMYIETIYDLGLKIYGSKLSQINLN